MSLLKDFKTFALRGNVMDLAVAVILGAAFGAIVSSFVDDILTPLLLTPALNAVGVDEIGKLHWGAVKYGTFLAAVIKFLVYAFVIFMMIRAMQRLEKKKEQAAAPGPSSTDQLLMEIRDELKTKK
ncbi:MAG: large conductance mechanosensitive channel protein MscL [Chitinophagaceae bacterium]|nr:large conductance mechanosensitive channel protein MscL [Chitinophagaceae bacterium]